MGILLLLCLSLLLCTCTNTNPNKEYLLCGACVLVLTPLFVMQLANTIAAMYTSTQPYSAHHVNHMVQIFKCAQRLCPGEPPMLVSSSEWKLLHKSVVIS